MLDADASWPGTVSLVNANIVKKVLDYITTIMYNGTRKGGELNMKTRTIEEIHDKEIGHKKFAWFVDTAIEKGHKISCIREFNEKFKFKFNGIPMEFDKMPELSAKWQLEQCELLWSYHQKLEALRNGKSES